MSKQEPTTKTNFIATIRQQSVDKLDILFMIDNSRSMGDKQDYLRRAVPDLIDRLVSPNCVDPANPTTVYGPSKDDGKCDQGKVEFPPVHDLHIGIVSSALGARGSDQCDPNDPSNPNRKNPVNPNLDAHLDDQAHLVARADTSVDPVNKDLPDRTKPVEDLNPDPGNSPFLYWFPKKGNESKTPGPGSVPILDVAQLKKDFGERVSGVHEYGCGLESQLETWYRFLIQPDPYKQIIRKQVDIQGQKVTVAAWDGVDEVIIKQRRDFLRPDSLVAVIALTDENDSEIDVRSFGGQAYNWLSSGFTPPRGTTICATNPADPGCVSCAVNPNDPNCKVGWKPGEDNLNLRHVRMKQKYGLDLQFPMSRYVTGLTSRRVPNRDGEYPPNATYYNTDPSGNNCTNPLFAASLPDGSDVSPAKLCNLPMGSRTPELVFYAHIGGVPFQLLHFDPADPKKSQLSDDDWTKILGKNPETYDYTGIDPHMIEATSPRNTGPNAGKLPAETEADQAVAANDPFKIPGREWLTDKESSGAGSDRQYACTFPLSTPRDCTTSVYSNICDCPNDASRIPKDGSGNTDWAHIPPVCDRVGNKPTTQVRAKAYPTIRELLLAKKLGAQGIVSSLCPQSVDDNAAKNDPLFGYRPAVAAIIERLKNALTNQCLPQPLEFDDKGNVPCLILATLPTDGAQETCAQFKGLEKLDAADPIYVKFREQQKADAAANPGSPDMTKRPICIVKQIPVPPRETCANGSTEGWCYVTGADQKCAQQIVFTTSAFPPGAITSLQCIESSAAANSANKIVDAGGGG